MMMMMQLLSEKIGPLCPGPITLASPSSLLTPTIRAQLQQNDSGLWPPNDPETDRQRISSPHAQDGGKAIGELGKDIKSYQQVTNESIVRGDTNADVDVGEVHVTRWARDSTATTTQKTIPFPSLTRPAKALLPSSALADHLARPRSDVKQRDAANKGGGNLLATSQDKYS
ncbi:unnamed protein product [Protopolystoma xenopodis]|uniref:Uncharacterized protein n=1 Tax=Protopolystoma xenopodis TaxID=117903 RepID=A0A3S5A3T8_9PLAT|nr:unnamed protein product [Protopolystoma xenopodis]